MEIDTIKSSDVERFNNSSNALAAAIAYNYCRVADEMEAERQAKLEKESKKVDELVESYVQNKDDLERLAKKSCKKCYGRGTITFSRPRQVAKEIACDCVVKNLKKIL